MHVPTPRNSKNKAEKLSESEFLKRFRHRFQDPAFRAESAAIDRLGAIAYKAYQEGRKAPETRKAGPGFANPDHDLGLSWLETKAALDAADADHRQAQKPRILLINGSDRNEATCPGEISKSFRLLEIAQKVIADSADVDILDLSLMTSEFGKTIYPCKGCVSTAMPLCHWPCSCYPNFSLGQADDWMDQIYPLWVRAHGIMIFSPVYWFQAPSALKLMVDRLVCADGGNPDPSSTEGKDAKKAKAIEMKGWDYPKHLKGRVFSIVVHGDAEGTDRLKSSLSDWLQAMELVPAGSQAALARYIGYLEPYATSHETLDRDQALEKEIENSVEALLATVKALRETIPNPWTLSLDDPRPK